MVGSAAGAAISYLWGITIRAPHGGVFVVFAMTDKSKGTRGISAFIVESSFPGFSVGKHEEKLGLHGSPTAEIVFTDCIVPKENLLGAEGKGFKIAMQTLDGGRIGIAAQALGIAEGAMEESINFAKTREQFGRPIAKFQNTQFLFADMHVAIEAARLLTYKAAVAKSEGGRFTVDAATAKLFASEAAMKITTKAVQVHGGSQRQCQNDGSCAAAFQLGRKLLHGVPPSSWPMPFLQR